MGIRPLSCIPDHLGSPRGVFVFLCKFFSARLSRNFYFHRPPGHSLKNYTGPPPGRDSGLIFSCPLAVCGVSIRFLLFAFGLVALAAVTLFPAFESFLRKDEHEISIFLDSALVAIILSTVVYGMNATDIVYNVLNSLKSLTTGGAFVIGVPLAESLIPKLAFYGYGIIISVVGYGAIILIGRLRKKIESKQPRHEGEDSD